MGIFVWTLATVEDEDLISSCCSCGFGYIRPKGVPHPGRQSAHYPPQSGRQQDCRRWRCLLRRVPPPDHPAARWCGRQSDVRRLSGRPRMGGHSWSLLPSPKAEEPWSGSWQPQAQPPGQGPENIAVEEVILHEDYDSWTITNDICLLKLEHEATLGEHVKTIGLPEHLEEYEAGTVCRVTGWGTTSA